jgi:hypothetical protein
MGQKEEVAQLLKTCEAAKDSTEAFSRGIDDFNARVEEQPAIVRPLVMRDFESNTGMSFNEWKAFLDKLGARYGTIYDTATRLADALHKGGNDAEITAAMSALKTAAAPFMEGVDVAVEAMETMETYLKGLPGKIDLVPDAFMKAEVRDELINSVPAYVERAQALKEGLKKTKEQLSALVAS